MEAFLDRRWQGWRDRANERAKTERKSPRAGGMTANEAYEVLGLKFGAKPDEIRAAHRRLMMKFHPDQGGSTFLAARINRAKENSSGEIAIRLDRGSLNSGKWEFCHTSKRLYLVKVLSSPGNRGGRMPA